MKLLMKETGTSVEELKEKVDLTPQFAEGGDVQLGLELQNFLNTFSKEKVKMDSDITRGPTLEEMLPSELVDLVKGNQEIPYVPELEETYLPQEQQEQKIPSVPDLETEEKVMERKFELPPSKPTPPDYKEIVSKIIKDKFGDKGEAFHDALLASIGHETGNKYRPVKQRKGPAKGLLQMEGKMRRDFEKYLKETDQMEDSTSTLNYFDMLLKGERQSYDIGAGHRKNIEKAIETNDPKVILKSLTDDFFKPGKPLLEKRYKKLSEIITGSKET